MLYKDLTTEQQEYLQKVFQDYQEFPEDATHIDVGGSFDAVFLKYIDGVEYHYWADEGWVKTLDTDCYASNTLEIPEDFCRKTGQVFESGINTQGDVENVSESLREAFETIRVLLLDKGVSLSFDSQGNVQILTAYGDYVLDTTREDLEDVISKMADVNKIIKGG